MNRDLLLAIGYEAHTMGCIYNKMGEPESPFKVWCMIEKMIDQKVKQHVTEQENAADTETERLFDGEYYIEYASADIVHLRRCG